MFGAVYIAFIIIGQLSITSIIPVTISIRDMYYRHEAAGMLSSRSVIAGLLAAEIPFIAVISLAFPVIFVSLIGLPNYDSDSDFLRGFGVYLFFGLNTAIYSYIGECYVSNQLLAQIRTREANTYSFFQSGQTFCFLVPGQGTAIVLANIFIGLNNAYSGFIASPALLTKNFFFAVQYWFVPGHYVYEGMLTSLFDLDDSRSVVVSQSSALYDQLDCVADTSGSCTVTVSKYFSVSFDEMWSLESFGFNIGMLLVWSICVRILGSIALKCLKYSGK